MEGGGMMVDSWIVADKEGKMISKGATPGLAWKDCYNSITKESRTEESVTDFLINSMKVRGYQLYELQSVIEGTPSLEPDKTGGIMSNGKTVAEQIAELEKSAPLCPMDKRPCIRERCMMWTYFSNLNARRYDCGLRARKNLNDPTP